MAKRHSYYGTYQPEHNVTYYKKQLQHSRGILLKNKNYATAKGYADYIKEKYNITNYTEKQFRDILSVMDLSYKEKNRRLAAFYERENKIITGQYDYERKRDYLERIENNLRYNEGMSEDVLRLFEDYVTPENYYGISDKLPEGDLIFVSSGDDQSPSGRAVDIKDNIYDAIVEGARLQGVDIDEPNDYWDDGQIAEFNSATPIQRLLMKEYDYSLEDAKDELYWDLGM